MAEVAACDADVADGTEDGEVRLVGEGGVLLLLLTEGGGLVVL